MSWNYEIKVYIKKAPLWTIQDVYFKARLQQIIRINYNLKT